MMARGSCTFRQRDLAAALKAAKQAGVPVRGWWISRDGELHFETGEVANDGDAQKKTDRRDEWEE
jgi:hypothetical protein